MIANYCFLWKSIVIVNGICWATESDSNYVLTSESACELWHYNLELKYWFNVSEGERVKKDSKRSSLPLIDGESEGDYEESKRKYEWKLLAGKLNIVQP